MEEQEESEKEKAPEEVRKKSGEGFGWFVEEGEEGVGRNGLNVGSWSTHHQLDSDGRNMDIISSIPYIRP
jgi:hypothetical protein